MNEKWMHHMEKALGTPYLAPELWPQRAAELRQRAEDTAATGRIALLETMLSGMGAEELYEVLSVAIEALKRINNKEGP
jgi:hypothetical protein